MSTFLRRLETRLDIQVKVIGALTVCSSKANCFRRSSSSLPAATFSFSRDSTLISSSAISVMVCCRDGWAAICWRMTSHSSWCCLSLRADSSLTFRSEILDSACRWLDQPRKFVNSTSGENAEISRRNARGTIGITVLHIRQRGKMSACRTQLTEDDP